jgi:hypothetical protein
MARWSPDHDESEGAPSGWFTARPGEYSGFVALRAALLVGLAFWGIKIARFSVPEGEMAGSFMHLILLPFHEAGHVIFMPLGEFMHVAGGTLGQLAMPLIVMLVFHWKTRDNFAAAIGLWWLAMSLIDVAPYAWDASNPQLMLLSGQTGEDGPHDWISMLGSFGRIQSAHAVGRFFQGAGVVVMMLALLWGALVVLRMWFERERD